MMPDTERQSSTEDAASLAVAPEAAERARKFALLIVFLVVVIDLLGFGIVLPILPIYGDEYLKYVIEGGKTNPLGGVVLGLLMASFSIMQFIFAPIWGRISDRVGRRPILLLGLAGSVTFYALFGFASTMEATNYQAATLALALLFVYRIGTGVAGATIATAQAVIADSTPPERRAHGMALIGAAFGIGFTFGPLLGIAANATGNRGMPGYLAAGLSLIALLLGLKLLPETMQQGSTSHHRRWLEWGSLQKALQMPSVGLLILTFFLATFAFANFENTLSLFTEDVLKLTRKGTNYTFAFVGLTLILAQGVLYRRLAKRVKELTFMRFGTVFMAAGLAALGVLGLMAHREDPEQQTAFVLCFLAVLAVCVTGFAFVTPSVQSLISRRSDPAKQGEILGVNQSASALARILGPLAGLPLFKLEASHALPYALGSGLLVLVLVLTLRLKQE